jgi:regulator of sigma E protease
MLWFTLKIFYQLITREISAKAVGGPIAIAKLSAESAQWGIEYLFGLLAVISVNLGLINLFPLPALDGGHILIFIIETIRRKRFSKRTRLIIQQIGYAFLLLLIIFITFNDITR